LRKVKTVLFALLTLWFTLVLIGIPGLVTKGSWRGLYGLLELILIVLFIGHLQKWKVEPLLTLASLIVWGSMQFVSHWYGFFFGASANQLTRYYGMFSRTYRFFPKSPTRTVPDAFHTVLGLLIVANLVVVIFQAVSLFGRSGKRVAT
jgi:hypothetical protein